VEGDNVKTYLFIYAIRKAQEQDTPDYCSVAAFGENQARAEAVAINRVHQDRLHILRADTVAEATWIREAADEPFVAELDQYGVALRMLAA
jgi:hypothetical protein